MFDLSHAHGAKQHNENVRVQGPALLSADAEQSIRGRKASAVACTVSPEAGKSMDRWPLVK